MATRTRLRGRSLFSSLPTYAACGCGLFILPLLNLIYVLLRYRTASAAWRRVGATTGGYLAGAQ